VIACTLVKPLLFSRKKSPWRSARQKFQGLSNKTFKSAEIFGE